MRPLPPAQAISPGHLGGIDDWARWVEGVRRLGGRWLRLREPHWTDREVAEVAVATRRRWPDLLLSITGRADLAAAGGAGGVHLPERGVPAQVAREVDVSLTIGRSVHDLDGVDRAVSEGVDYVLLAPVFAPLSKPAERTGLGLAGLAEACRRDIPVYALGGVTIGRLPEIAGAGAAGVAGISLFDPASDSSSSASSDSPSGSTPPAGSRLPNALECFAPK